MISRSDAQALMKTPVAKIKKAKPVKKSRKKAKGKGKVKR
jgi:hypothetical protein